MCGERPSNSTSLHLRESNSPFLAPVVAATHTNAQRGASDLHSMISFRNSSADKKRSRPGGSIRCGTALTGFRSYLPRLIAKLNVLHMIVRYLLIEDAAYSSRSRLSRNS